MTIEKLTDNVQPLDLISAVNELVEEANSAPTNLSDLVDDTATTPVNKATTATKLGSSNVGGETQPLYLSNGEPTACTYALAKSVPSDAVFTDTTYSAFIGADGTDAGSMGLVPAPLATDNNKFLKGDGTWTYATGSGGADIDLSNLSVAGEAHFQAPLVSGTNIKTINSNSLLGSGDITISSGGTYTQGTGISIANNVINHSNSVTAGTIGTSSATSGSTISVPYANYDSQGHITSKGTHTHTVTGFLSSVSYNSSTQTLTIS